MNTPPQAIAQNSTPEQSQQAEREPLFRTVKFGGRRPKLERLIKYDPQSYEKILMFIERGAYDYIAAEAFGVTQKTFISWMNKGEKAKDGIYRKFFLDVMQAKARARVLAEMQVRAEDPKFFLLNGPGKTLPNRPGWTNERDVAGDQERLMRAQLNPGRKEEVSNADLAKTLEVMSELGFLTEPLETVDPNEEDLVEEFLGETIDTTGTHIDHET